MKELTINWQAIVVLFCLFVILPYSVYRDKKRRKEYCDCDGCQNNESGWLSNEYRKKNPNCKMK